MDAPIIITIVISVCVSPVSSQVKMNTKATFLAPSYFLSLAQLQTSRKRGTKNKPDLT